MVDDTVFDLCPHCGAFIIEDTDTCPSCNMPLAEEDPTRGGDVDDKDMQCAICGYFMRRGEDKCPSCNAPVVYDRGPGMDSDDLEGFLDFLVDEDRVSEESEIDLPISEGDLDELDEGVVGEGRNITPMDEFFDDVALSDDADDMSIEKPDVLEEVQKTYIVESLSGKVDREVQFDEIEPEDIVRLCANCGGLVASSASECTVCGEELSPDKLLFPRNVRKDILDKMPMKEAEDVMKRALGIVDDMIVGVIEPPEEFADTIVCTNCGAFVPSGAAKCPTCGTGVGDMPDVPPAEQPSAEFSINVCTRCGAFLSQDSKVCNVCGFEVEEAEPGLPVPEPARDDDRAEGVLKKLLGVSVVDDLVETDAAAGELDLCPDCGAFVSPNAPACSVCGSSLVDAGGELPDMDFDLEEEIAELSESRCPNCDSKLPAGISDCEVCGFSFFSTEPSVDELEEMESIEGMDLATDIIDNLDIQLPDVGIPELTEGAAREQEPDDDDLGIDGLLEFANSEEGDILDDMDADMLDDEEDYYVDIDKDEVSTEEFESLLNDIDETIQMEADSRVSEGKVHIELEERLKLLKKAYESGAISKELYRRNLEIFLDDLVLVDELVERVEDPGDDGLPKIMPPVERLARLKKAFEDGVIDKDTYRHNLQNLMAELEGRAGLHTEEPSEGPDNAAEVAPPEPEQEYEEAIETPPDIPEEPEYDEDDSDEFEKVSEEPDDSPPDYFDDSELIRDKLADSNERGRFNLDTWDYGIYASLATSLLYLTFNWVIPGSVSPLALAAIFGVILLAGIYLIINCRGAFNRRDVVRGLPFSAGGLLLSFILVHWYMNMLTSEIGRFAQPGFDRILLSAGILLIGTGIIWVRSRIRYIYMWITGTTLLFLFALGELVYFERWEFATVQPPGALVFGTGAVMIFFSTFLLAYEKAIENSIEADIVRGDISYLRRDYTAALDSYDSALMKASDELLREDVHSVPINYDVPWYSKGAALILMGELEEGIKCMDMALAINPNNEMAWTNKGNALSRLGNYEGAMDCYEKAIEANPRYVIAYNNMGNALARTKDYIQALKYYNKAIKLNPEYQDAWINKGYVLAKMGKNEMAMKCIDMVTKKQDGLVAAPAPGGKAAKA